MCRLRLKYFLAAIFFAVFSVSLIVKLRKIYQKKDSIINNLIKEYNSEAHQKENLRTQLKKAEESLQSQRDNRKEFDHVTIKALSSQYFLLAVNNPIQKVELSNTESVVEKNLLELFDFFHKSNLFIMDTGILKSVYESLEKEGGILNTKTGLVDINRVDKFNKQTFHFEKVDNVLKTSGSADFKTHINFGVAMDDFEDFYKVRLISYLLSFLNKTLHY